MTTQTAQIQAHTLKASEARALRAGEMFKGIYVVNSLTRKTDKNGKPYWEMMVSDETGTLSAKVWSDAGWLDRSTSETESRPSLLTEPQIAELRGRVVGLTGKTVDFRGQVQHNFNSISLLDQVKFPPSKFIAHSEIPLAELQSRFDNLVEGCSPEIRDFLRFVFGGERAKAFSEAPAAVTNHHAYAHGLLEHTITLTETARLMAEHYKGVYPSVDVSIVVAGALLHDLGKIASYAMSPVPEMTLQGAVLDHIALGYAEFTRLAEEAKLPHGTATQLGHIMLSHHGQKEFGSPIVPATLEALIVAAADALDFLLFCWKDATSDMPQGQNISAFSHAAQRRFWRPEEQGR
ncbi:MAG: HD domain-containing protein [Synergistaceae bacterium]|jgi:3'-5' exoribonuclease|nr:HD domain-containing protein [Synergistaceae bacterium]